MARENPIYTSATRPASTKPQSSGDVAMCPMLRGVPVYEALERALMFDFCLHFSDITAVVNNADHVPSSPISYDMAEGLAAHEVSSCLSIARPFQAANLFDLFNVLKVRKRVCHAFLLLPPILVEFNDQLFLR